MCETVLPRGALGERSTWARGYEYATCLVDARWARPTTDRQTRQTQVARASTDAPGGHDPWCLQRAGRATNRPRHTRTHARTHARRIFCCQGQRTAMGAASSTLENLPEINVDTLLLMAVDTHTRHQNITSSHAQFLSSPPRKPWAERFWSPRISLLFTPNDPETIFSGIPSYIR
eukprot:COSAG01_NODE_1314_length_10760_cov_3.305131_12_plen_175_part_00